ncbi:MAG TPA: hypothetical protein PKK48_08590, partial [Phycisphaerae bacterium]|nr:hypothetical protein [Phycisphaerae bacterium]
SRASDAKKAYDAAMEELQEHSIEEPQFPIMQESEPAKAAEPVTATPADENDDSWREQELAGLVAPEISPKVLEKLRDNEPSITTMGELADWQNVKGDFWAKDIKGIGPEAAGEIADATLAFWQRAKKDETTPQM